MSDNTERSVASAPMRGSHGCHPNARLIVSDNPTIDEYRTALQKCVADKAADWKAACDSAEAACKVEGELNQACDGRQSFAGLWHDHAGALRSLLERTK